MAVQTSTVTTLTGDLTITPNGTNNVILSPLAGNGNLPLRVSNAGKILGFSPANLTAGTPTLTDTIMFDDGGTAKKVTIGDVLSLSIDAAATAVNKTASKNQYWVVTASGKTITLPASPAAGDRVTVVVNGEFTDTVVARNGSNIMGLAENITLDKNYAAMDFTFVDNTEGWRLS